MIKNRPNSQREMCLRQFIAQTPFFCPSLGQAAHHPRCLLLPFLQRDRLDLGQKPLMCAKKELVGFGWNDLLVGLSPDKDERGVREMHLRTLKMRAHAKAIFTHVCPK